MTKVALIDVGGRRGIHERWQKFRQYEPDPEEWAKLNRRRDLFREPTIGRRIAGKRLSGWSHREFRRLIEGYQPSTRPIGAMRISF